MARKTLMQGMEVYRVASHMGLTQIAGSGSGGTPGGGGAAGGGSGQAGGNRRGSVAAKSKQPAGRLSMADKAEGKGAPGNMESSDRAGGRFLDSLWELQCARKVLEDM